MVSRMKKTKPKMSKRRIQGKGKIRNWLKKANKALKKYKVLSRGAKLYGKTPLPGAYIASRLGDVASNLGYGRKKGRGVRLSGNGVRLSGNGIGMRGNGTIMTGRGCFVGARPPLRKGMGCFVGARPVRKIGNGCFVGARPVRKIGGRSQMMAY